MTDDLGASDAIVVVLTGEDIRTVDRLRKMRTVGSEGVLSAAAAPGTAKAQDEYADEERAQVVRAAVSHYFRDVSKKEEVAALAAASVGVVGGLARDQVDSGPSRTVAVADSLEEDADISEDVALMVARGEAGRWASLLDKLAR